MVSADAEESEIDILVVEPVKKSKPIMAMVRLEGKVLEMEVDTGAVITLVSERTFMKLWGNKRLLQPLTIQLKTFTGERIRVLGGDGGSCRAQQPEEEVGVICGARSWPKSSGKELVGEPKLDGLS